MFHIIRYYTIVTSPYANTDSHQIPNFRIYFAKLLQGETFVILGKTIGITFEDILI